MQYTHFTKYGFGGLLRAGLHCYIYCQSGNDVAIILQDGSLFDGNINDLILIP